MINDPQMSPETSPNGLGKAGVRRVNNMPIYIVGVLMCAFLLVMVLVASDRSKKQSQPTETKEDSSAATSGNARKFAIEIAGDRKDGIIPEQPALVTTDLNTPPMPPTLLTGPVAIVRPEQHLDLPPKSSQDQQPLNMARDEEMHRIRIAKLQQLEEAIKAKSSQSNANAATQRGTSSSVYSNTPMTRDEQLARLASVRQQIDASTRDDPTAAYKARLTQIQSIIPTTTAQTAQAAVVEPNSVSRFDNQGQSDRWRLNSLTETPRSKFELRAGFVIPAMLISGINSELPGQIIGQVSQNVYDTATGTYLLIPQGTRLVGQYSSSVSYGQARVLVAWQRIVFPDGKAMDIGAMPGSDIAGYSGFNDLINNHYFRVFSSAFLMSAVTAGIALSQPQQTGTTAQTARSALSEALGQQLGQVTAQLIAKNINIAPTLEIRPGYRFNVMVTKDITFSKEYQSFDY